MPHEATRPRLISRLCLCILITLVGFALAGLVSVTILWEKNGRIQYEYGVVIDAGSTRTTLYVHKWSSLKEKNTAMPNQIHVCVVKGRGLSSYVNNPQGLAPGLETCLQEAEEAIPRDKISTTSIYLGATGGMRLLNEVNKTASEAILIVTRDTIQKFSFKFTNPEKQARIITGAEEGMYSWVTVNYITGKFGVKPPNLLKSGKRWMLSEKGENTVGALDLGGASTQISFFPRQNTILPGEYGGHFVLFGLNFSVYSNSYLCYGVNEVTRQYRALLVKNQNYSNIIDNPCGPTGNITYHAHSDIFEAPCTKDSRYSAEIEADQNTLYAFVGGSNDTACYNQVQELFNFSAPCPLGEKCSFNGIYQPDVNGKFFAFAGFYFQLDFMNLTTSDKVDLHVYKKELVKLCSMSWNEIKDMRTFSADFLPLYCFGGHYILTLLSKAYKFEDWSNISFVHKLNGVDVGWSLGFMVAASDDYPDVAPDVFITEETFISSLTILCVVILVILVLGVIFYKLRCHKRKAKDDRQELTNDMSYASSHNTETSIQTNC